LRNEAENSKASSGGIGVRFAARKCWLFWLLGLFGPLTLAETDTRAAAVLVDEFDAGGALKSTYETRGIRGVAR
jgi:hypothetical protein